MNGHVFIDFSFSSKFKCQLLVGLHLAYSFLNSHIDVCENTIELCCKYARYFDCVF